MHSFDVLDAAVTPTSSVASPTTPTSEPTSTKKVDVMKPSVSQFALKPEKGLVYTSTR